MGLLERRKQREAELTASYIRSVLSYDGDSGEFRWLIRRSARVRAGAIAGGPTSAGYWDIRIDGKKFMAHRLAWLISFGSWPDFDIDHEDGNGLNNRLSNLRQATRSQNSANRTTKGCGKSGVKGVQWHAANQKWVAAVGKKYIGSYNTIEEASSAYHRAANLLYLDYARPQ